ncbi:hypothetical protein ABZ595_21045 [Streptomyces rubradiris]|uniref:hypothetical protein n=1 Tax=Streptomyces rubradiris TaxID=285531 RepID=UPI0033D2B131
MKRLEGKIAPIPGTVLTPGPLDVTGAAPVGSWVAQAVDAGAVRFGGIDSRPYEDFPRTVRAGLESVRLTARPAWPHRIDSRGCVLGSGSGIAGPREAQLDVL